jgi:hypothetical protein
MVSPGTCAISDRLIFVLLTQAASMHGLFFVFPNGVPVLLGLPPGGFYPAKGVPPVGALLFVFIEGHANKIDNNFKGSRSGHVSAVFCLPASDTGHKSQGMGLIGFVHIYSHKRIVF